jgi:hypothetical protein
MAAFLETLQVGTSPIGDRVLSRSGPSDANAPFARMVLRPAA